jgi:hypothetical protein
LAAMRRDARVSGWAGMLEALTRIDAARGRGDWCVCGHHRASHMLGRARCRLTGVCGCQLYRRAEPGDVLTLCDDCGRYVGPGHECHQTATGERR